MIYNEALEKIHSLLHFGSRPGLDRILMLLNRIGNPQNKCKYIHIAGTNGKGSVSQMLSSVLTEAGYKTGLFISPFITDFRERIQINGNMIPENDLAEVVEEIFPEVEKMAKENLIITEFEFVNAIAFYYFAKKNCDIVVLETGMGGLLDCTNTIPAPLCSVITPIGLDHTSVLGDTLEKITYQKCGIIKKDSYTVIAKQTDSAIERQIVKDCTQKHNMFFFGEDCKVKVINSDIYGTEVKYKGKKFTLNLVGLHQIDNLKTTLTTIEVLNHNHFYDITSEDIAYGIEKAQNPARFELLSKDPIVILDGAHNPNGMEAFSKSVDEYTNGKRTLITGMLKDKDIDTSMDYISKKFDTVITLTVNNPRTIGSQELAEICKDKFCNVLSFDTDYAGAIDKALEINNTIIICGSLYLAGDLRPILLEKLKK